MHPLELIEKHKVVRRSLVLWSVALITWATYRVYTRPIDMNTVGIYTATCGILGTVLALYHIGRGREDLRQYPDIPPGGA